MAKQNLPRWVKLSGGDPDSPAHPKRFLYVRPYSRNQLLSLALGSDIPETEDQSWRLAEQAASEYLASNTRLAASLVFVLCKPSEDAEEEERLPYEECAAKILRSRGGKELLEEATSILNQKGGINRFLKRVHGDHQPRPSIGDLSLGLPWLDHLRKLSGLAGWSSESGWDFWGNQGWCFAIRHTTESCPLFRQLDRALRIAVGKHDSPKLRAWADSNEKWEKVPEGCHPASALMLLACSIRDVAKIKGLTPQQRGAGAIFLSVVQSCRLMVPPIGTPRVDGHVESYRADIESMIRAKSLPGGARKFARDSIDGVLDFFKAETGFLGALRGVLDLLASHRRMKSRSKSASRIRENSERDDGCNCTGWTKMTLAIMRRQILEKLGRSTSERTLSRKLPGERFAKKAGGKQGRWSVDPCKLLEWAGNNCPPQKRQD